MNNIEIKKILLILPTNSGTMAIRASDLHDFLIKKNISVTVAVLQNSQNSQFSFNNEYIFETKIKSIFRVMLKVLWLKKIKKKVRPDISISVLNGCSINNILAGGNEFKIGMFRAPIEQLRDWNGDFYTTNFTYRYLFPKLDKLYCVSEGIRKSILENYPQINRNKVETVYNVFDFDKLKCLGDESIDLTFFETHKVIVNVGRIEEIKGQDRVIRAFSLLDWELKKEAKLVFIGENGTEYYHSLLKLIEDLGLNENVFFLGNVSNPYKYISKSSIFVLPSLQEGLPGALIEALILKVPVISTNSSYGVWEILSVEDKYDINLKKPLISSAGIITPNEISSDLSSENTNIHFLYDAMLYLLKNENLKFDFDCVLKFTQDAILEKYINPNESD